MQSDEGERPMLGLLHVPAARVEPEYYTKLASLTSPSSHKEEGLQCNTGYTGLQQTAV